MGRGGKMTRADDERHLEWLSLRANGTKASDIALHDGEASSGQVIKTTNAIRDADFEYSGEPLDDVTAGYW